MGETTIQWTDAVWNPVTGCQKVSAGCKHCYAERVFPRAYARTGRRFTDVACHPERLSQPLRWRKPRRVFVNSMSDLFHEDVPAAFIEQVFSVMTRCPQHTFQVLTKRPQRMRDLAQTWMHAIERMGYEPELAPNVWLGVSVEDQATAEERIPLLLGTPAAVRFVSAEPLLGWVDLTGGPEFHRRWLRSGYQRARGCLLDDYLPSLDWVIVGGESGPGARPMNLGAARAIVEQCRRTGTACFVKQLGARPIESYPRFAGAQVQEADGEDFREFQLRDRKGGDPEEWPPDLRVREWPDWARVGT